MPELPEVETTRQGLLPRLRGNILKNLVVRNPRLRWPVPADLASHIVGHRLIGLHRRGKYLLFDFGTGTQIVHLGMSGSLRIIASAIFDDALSKLAEPKPIASPPHPNPLPHAGEGANAVSKPIYEAAGIHDHIDWEFDGGLILRLRDPRRFGAVLWSDDPAHHPLLSRLGPEPLTPAFDTQYLYAQCRRRSAAIKQVIMDSHVVVGVGNIYASESLFHAGIRPGTAAQRLTRPACARLVAAIKRVLESAIACGGSSLRDYVQSTGELGYFQLQTQVYDRAGLPCKACGTPIRRTVHGARAAYFCPHCQR